MNISSNCVSVGEMPIIKIVSDGAIRSVSNIARAILLHALVHWKDGAAADLWPMAINYAT